MKYNEETFKKEVDKLYNNEIEIIGHFKGLERPILVKDKYGVMQVKIAKSILQSRPTIKTALNKTEYFMAQLRELQPKLASQLTPVSEYEALQKKMLFDTKFGIVSVNPENLLHGHVPTIRCAIDRKDYIKKQLNYIYSDDDYEFDITSIDRHVGRITLICKKHGPQHIDSDWIFSGCGCPQCNSGWTKSNVLYIIQLSNNKECFYKLGISYKLQNGDIRRFKEYRKLGFEIKIIRIYEFETYEQCRDKELALKQLIKNDLYIPETWEYNRSTECFKEDLLDLILKNI